MGGEQAWHCWGACHRLNQVQKLLLGVTRGVGNVVAVAVGLQPIHVRLATRPVLVSCTVLVVGCVAATAPSFVAAPTTCCRNQVKQVLLCVFGSVRCASLIAVLLQVCQLILGATRRPQAQLLSLKVLDCETTRPLSPSRTTRPASAVHGQGHVSPSYCPVLARVVSGFPSNPRFTPRTTSAPIKWKQTLAAASVDCTVGG